MSCDSRPAEKPSPVIRGVAEERKHTHNPERNGKTGETDEPRESLQSQAYSFVGLSCLLSTTAAPGARDSSFHPAFESQQAPGAGKPGSTPAAVQIARPLTVQQRSHWPLAR